MIKLRLIKFTLIFSIIILFLINCKTTFTYTQNKNITKQTQIEKEDDKNGNVLTATISNGNITKTEETINWIDIEVTFYTNNKQSCGNSKGISANGTNLLKYTLNRGNTDYYIPIAAPKNIPFGTRLYVENLGNCIVVDRGSAIKWKNDKMIIDVFIPNTTEKHLNQLGRKITKGYIVK